ncbi:MULTISPECIES: universal stress protein [Pasteurellaceae]|uniref:Universal stress protein n=1 Tax=Pasteurella atlantica TaxID=2827233 RepID=A0AAW8CPC4_9PAST|nr:universal stress protein [Pasteurella atlantica]MBR0573281.1 universal stress protein [Pasteurella atlantica]MDP8039103.1 universal stress protein [Pasteurella atlantica]MDP8041298.1 universal stress protein [Pasteurella atlantica]MDP8043435.1 universal stress protein [Pasteurella atlantica]MDP8045521.1 universal stress protein [Pasteurella atlantica]
MYNHILVAVDLSDESLVLLRKGADFAKACNAKLSIIHVDVNFSDLYTGLIDINMTSVQDNVTEETLQVLSEFSEKIDYPVTERLSGTGDFTQVLQDAIDEYKVDLLITGHHQDFWSKLVSSTRQAMNSISVDMLVVPLKDN